MKAISIKQPWAWAFLHGKNVENRNWRYLPKYRGPILIHASQTFEPQGYQWMIRNGILLRMTWEEVPDRSFFGGSKNGLGMGGVIAHGNLVDVVSEMDSPWFFGPIGLVIENVKSVEFYPCKGQLGLFDIDTKDMKL